jgi:hypothetical protein
MCKRHQPSVPGLQPQDTCLVFRYTLSTVSETVTVSQVANHNICISGRVLILCDGSFRKKKKFHMFNSRSIKCRDLFNGYEQN